MRAQPVVLTPQPCGGCVAWGLFVSSRATHAMQDASKLCHASRSCAVVCHASPAIALTVAWTASSYTVFPVPVAAACPHCLAVASSATTRRANAALARFIIPGRAGLCAQPPPPFAYGMISPWDAALLLVKLTPCRPSAGEARPTFGDSWDAPGRATGNLDLNRLSSLHLARCPVARSAGPREGCADRQAHDI